MPRKSDPNAHRWAAEQAAARMERAAGEERAAWALIVEGYTKLSELAEAQKKPQTLAS
jgi:hypothetical protein